MLHKVGKQSRFVAGLRYTDEETMDVVQMVLAGKTNKDLVSLINQKGARAVGISGMDANCIQARQYTVDEGDLGFVGEIEEIHEELILDIIEKGYIPRIPRSPAGQNRFLWCACANPCRYCTNQQSLCLGRICQKASACPFCIHSHRVL